MIEVTDDGRGVDWDRVRALAVERGLPSTSKRELEQALFSDGFSLKYKVSETSGRGVGLAAVKNVVTAMGGRIEVQSAHQTGTTWRFVFPIATLSDAAAEDER